MCSLNCDKNAHEYNTLRSRWSICYRYTGMRVRFLMHWIVRRESFRRVLVVQDIQPPSKHVPSTMDRVVVVRWADLSRVHAVGCHLSYDEPTAIYKPSRWSSKYSDDPMFCTVAHDRTVVYRSLGGVLQRQYT